MIGNEQADTAARLTGAEDEVMLEFSRSSRSFKTAFHAAALHKTGVLFDNGLAAGSSSARWYSQVTQRRPALLSGLWLTVGRTIQRLRLGYLCRAQILDTALHV